MKSTILAALVSLAIVGDISTPKINSISPATPGVTTKPQLITIAGEDFLTGLTLLATTPSGAVRSLTAGDIQAPKPTSFQVSFVFEAAGTYSFTVVNTDGGKSDPFPVQARAASRQPAIDQVKPEEPTRGTEPQVVTINGRNFAPGLRVSVTDPAGTVTVHETFDKLDAQTAVLRLVFDQAGPWAIMVTNASGESSNSVTVTVR